MKKKKLFFLFIIIFSIACGTVPMTPFPTKTPTLAPKASPTPFSPTAAVPVITPAAATPYSPLNRLVWSRIDSEFSYASELWARCENPVGTTGKISKVLYTIDGIEESEISKSLCKPMGGLNRAKFKLMPNLEAIIVVAYVDVNGKLEVDVDSPDVLGEPIYYIETSDGARTSSNHYLTLGDCQEDVYILIQFINDQGIISPVFIQAELRLE